MPLSDVWSRSRTVRLDSAGSSAGSVPLIDEYCEETKLGEHRQRHQRRGDRAAHRVHPSLAGVPLEGELGQARELAQLRGHRPRHPVLLQHQGAERRELAHLARHRPRQPVPPHDERGHRVSRTIAADGAPAIELPPRGWREARSRSRSAASRGRGRRRWRWGRRTRPRRRTRRSAPRRSLFKLAARPLGAALDGSLVEQDKV